MALAQPKSLPPLRAGVGARDVRLDFFRGIAMFIILIAHIPSNWLTLWIPARFGFSDATEMFVFCSGMASAIAFGKVFREQGHMMGSVRVAFRVWQVYWAHIGLFFAVAAAMVVLNNLVPDGRDYVGQLNLYPFFNRPQENLVGLLTLTYVPNYFDVLPMYLVILAMMPFVIALVGFNRWVAAAVLIAIWLSASVFDLNFPAEPWSERQWFFNPLGWQLVFFTGFALMAGWIPAPPVDWRLFAVAVLIVLVSVPFAYFRVYNEVEWFLEWRREWRFLFTKTDFGILRYVHFLSLAYIAWCLVGPKGARILPSETGGLFARIWQVILNAILKVGQQSLVVFVSSMFLARLLGALFDQVGRSHFSMAWVNILGALIIIALAYGVGWIKSQPWKQRKSAHAAP
ncbi:OpgC domain-containing protein [Cognatiyoonia sp. IB215182]|nr:OpgC domain-containing protein [Cognatiyoonia sp. IB215182]